MVLRFPTPLKMTYGAATKRAALYDKIVGNCRKCEQRRWT